MVVQLGSNVHGVSLAIPTVDIYDSIAIDLNRFGYGSNFNYRTFPLFGNITILG